MPETLRELEEDEYVESPRIKSSKVQKTAPDKIHINDTFDSGPSKSAKIA